MPFHLSFFADFSISMIVISPEKRGTGVVCALAKLFIVYLCNQLTVASLNKIKEFTFSCFFFSVSNKQLLVQGGVIDAVMELSSSEVMAVIFKLLGLLRMLIDGQGNSLDKDNHAKFHANCMSHIS